MHDFLFSCLNINCMISCILDNECKLERPGPSQIYAKCMFPDSRIAFKFSCGRTKITQIVKRSLAPAGSGTASANSSVLNSH